MEVVTQKGCNFSAPWGRATSTGSAPYLPMACRAPVLAMRLTRGRERGLTPLATFYLAVFISAKGTTKSVIRLA